jgi:serine/threonine-protein kinase
VERAVLRALAKEPGDRFASVAEFCEALVTPLSGLPEPGADSRRCIAVLPFTNASPDPDNEYVSDGITDELINALAQVAGMQVAPRTSVFALKGKHEDVRAIGALLDVSVVLEGTVRRAGDRFRVTAQLSDTADGRLLWSERFDREDRDILALQDELARTIVSTLRNQLFGPAIDDPVSHRYTDNQRAYHLYLRGRHAWNKRTGADTLQAIQFFEQAIAEDPEYALAYTGLADAWALQVDYRAAPVESGLNRAREEALKAIALDDSLAEAHTSLAWVLFIHDWDWEAAGREFRRAIELNPRYATCRQWHSWYLAAMGHTREAVQEGERAVELDPASMSIQRSLGWLHYYARRPELGIVQLRRALVMNPEHSETHLIMGLVCTRAGRFAEARQALETTLLLSPQDSHAMAALAHLAVLEGREREAESMRGQFTDLSNRRYVSPTDWAKLTLALGQYDATFHWLEQARAERRGWLAYLRVEPLFDPIRGDPRFAELLRVMRLE